jgi:hypothetical protein
VYFSDWESGAKRQETGQGTWLPLASRLPRTGSRSIASGPCDICSPNATGTRLPAGPRCFPLAAGRVGTLALLEMFQEPIDEWELVRVEQFFGTLDRHELRPVDFPRGWSWLAIGRSRARETMHHFLTFGVTYLTQVPKLLRPHPGFLFGFPACRFLQGAAFLHFSFGNTPGCSTVVRAGGMNKENFQPNNSVAIQESPGGLFHRAPPCQATFQRDLGASPGDGRKNDFSAGPLCQQRHLP